MIDDTSAFDGIPERFEIPKVAGDELYRKVVQVIEPAGRAYETANLFAAFEQDSNEMRSDEPSSACYECFHYRFALRTTCEEDQVKAAEARGRNMLRLFMGQQGLKRLDLTPNPVLQREVLKILKGGGS
jgi:hypothetical protein